MILCVKVNDRSKNFVSKLFFLPSIFYKIFYIFIKVKNKCFFYDKGILYINKNLLFDWIGYSND